MRPALYVIVTMLGMAVIVYGGWEFIKMMNGIQ